MIIGACGFGSTGSSVVTDYLKEFDQITVKDDLEFTWVSGLDSLIDLERAVMFPHNRTSDSIYAIKRYMELVERKKHSYQRHGLSASVFEKSAREFIESITTVKWNWYDSRVSYRYRSRYLLHTFMQKKVIPKLEIKQGKQIKLWPLQEVRVSIKPENYYPTARKHLRELLTGMG